MYRKYLLSISELVKFSLIHQWNGYFQLLHQLILTDSLSGRNIFHF